MEFPKAFIAIVSGKQWVRACLACQNNNSLSLVVPTGGKAELGTQQQLLLLQSDTVVRAKQLLPVTVLLYSVSILTYDYGGKTFFEF